ncbi:MAG: GNAT family N-acetyltransferase [Spirochaetia bacterium]|nr:GNAT family N-acetyltransferase [Spirochaetia bacterium]
MSDYAIALIREDQIGEAQALMSQCFEAKLASIFYLHPESTLVATYQNRVVAGINLDVYQVNKRIKMGYIGWLYTDKEHRGNSLAGRLLDEAIIFLKKEGCTSLSGCVEGDNPASFKQLANRGFAILGLKDQLKLFRLGTAKVYHHASRFFDMGYFLWHKSLTEQTFQASRTGMAALLPTLLGNTLLFYFCLKGWNLLTLAGFHPITETFSSLTPAQQVLMLAFPSLFLLARTGAMALLAKMQKKNGEDSSKEMENATVRADMNLRNSEGREQRVMVYRSWDTAWILAIILTLTIGFPFPVPGNLYIKGNDWKLEKEKNLLARMAIASLAAVALVCQLAPKGMPLLFGLSLLALDSFFFFYPFCGFNASRIKRMGAKTYGLYLVITLAVMLLLLVY